MIWRTGFVVTTVAPNRLRGTVKSHSKKRMAPNMTEPRCPRRPPGGAPPVMVAEEVQAQSVSRCGPAGTMETPSAGVSSEALKSLPQNPIACARGAALAAADTWRQTAEREAGPPPPTVIPVGPPPPPPPAQPPCRPITQTPAQPQAPAPAASPAVSILHQARGGDGPTAAADAGRTGSAGSADGSGSLRSSARFPVAGKPRRRPRRCVRDRF